ncbi:MAG TPA: DUF4038 domain-containing protein [Opitutaceae bacterium]|jgi:hypothetical protein|nr:DUF4038 domain-containing protein [Opitutaceae bacterium]
MNRRTALKTLAMALGAAPARAWAQKGGWGPAPDSLPRLRVHPAGHYLQREDGKPFFWLGDTAWELIHRSTAEECSYYLRTRARQGFTVIQTVVLSEFDGLRTPTEQGLLPFAGADPRRPNPDYFQRVDAILAEAAALGLYVALVPVWGDKLTAPWGVGPRVFTVDHPEVAAGYGRYLGDRFRSRTNVIWLLGGDRPPRLAGLNDSYLSGLAKDAGFPPDMDWTPIWRALAAGLAEGGKREPLIVYHPQGGANSSSVSLPAEAWLSVNGMQSGHGGGHDVPVWEWIARDVAIRPAKPTLDLEPNYEDHPYDPWPRWDPATGYFRDHDVRKQTYRSVFAGGCGVTYGHHAVWQFASSRYEVINHADRSWFQALWRPGGTQMQFLRALIESRPFFEREPAPRLITGTFAPSAQLVATCDRSRSYALVYFPENDEEAVLDLAEFPARALRAWWYDPRSGVGLSGPDVVGGGHARFRSPPYGPDWVLALDDPAAGYPPPGLPRQERPRDSL